MDLNEFMLLQFDDDKMRKRVKNKNIIYDYELHFLSFDCTFFLLPTALKNARACVLFNFSFQRCNKADVPYAKDLNVLNIVCPV